MEAGQWIAGLLAFTQLGQLEDPEFTVKTAAIITTYPGASAEEVELEVTECIEIVLQELPQVDYVDTIKKELSLVRGVSRVELWDQQTRCMVIDV